MASPGSLSYNWRREWDSFSKALTINCMLLIFRCLLYMDRLRSSPSGLLGSASVNTIRSRKRSTKRAWYSTTGRGQTATRLRSQFWITVTDSGSASPSTKNITEAIQNAVIGSISVSDAVAVLRRRGVRGPRPQQLLRPPGPARGSRLRRRSPCSPGCSRIGAAMIDFEPYVPADLFGALFAESGKHRRYPARYLGAKLRRQDSPAD